MLAGLALLTILAGIGVLLAPVIAEDPVVSWPSAGHAPRSTVLPLVPYRPVSLDARVPCTVLAALDRRPGGGDALRTQPATAGKPDTALAATDREVNPVSQGLVVSVQSGVVQFSASGRTLVRDVLPSGGCTYRVIADAGGVRVLRDGTQRAAAAVQVPEVSELATDAGDAAAAGLAVSLHTDARYESTATPMKIGFLVACAAGLLALLGLAWRWWGGRVPAPPAVRSRLRPRFPDAVLVVVSAAWVLLAPTNFDDSWYLLMARGAATSGSIGNAIYMFNATENPFVASQYVLQAWGWLGGWGLTWMRLVPLIYGLLTWLLLRLVLVKGFGSELGTGSAVWALLVAYLLWWLPYGMTLRPEPLIVLLAAAALLLTELARRRRSIGALAGASAAVVLALSSSPSGLVAAAPLLLALPWLWRWWRAQDRLVRLAAALVLAATSTGLILVGCADATLGDVLESTAVHQWYYQAFPWYQEYVHYLTILSFQDSSQWARRAPIVLTVAALLAVVLGGIRRWRPDLASAPAPQVTDRDPVHRLLMYGAACSALALLLLAPTPTKFVNHFGAAAAAPVVFLAAALLRSPLQPSFRLTLQWLESRARALRAPAIVATVGTALVIGAVCWSFAGPNLWRPYSDRGQPFGNHLTANDDHPDLGSMRPMLGPVQLANPFVWIGVALAAAGVLWWWRRHRGREPQLSPDRAVLVAGSTALVVMSLVVFVWAPLRQYPGWSVAVSTIRGVQGDPCALAGYTQVLDDAPVQPVQSVPAEVARTSGAFTLAAGRPVPVPAPVPGTQVWHDDLDDPASAPDTGPLTNPGGLLITPWYTLPADEPAAGTLLVPLLGIRADQALILEYATTAGPDPEVAGLVGVPADPTVSRAEWQQAAVALDQLGPRRPSQVRLVIGTQIGGADSWLAVGQPRLAGWRPLSAVTAGAPVYADQLTATLLPCVNQVTVAHGIAQAPEVLVLSDEGFGRGFLDLGFELWRGGTQIPVRRTATAVRIPSRLVPNGPPSLPWGRVERVIYDHPVGLVDVRVDQAHRAGWTRLPTLADDSYHGRF